MKIQFFALLPFLLFAGENEIHFLGKKNGVSKHEIVCQNGNSAVVIINEANRDTYLLQEDNKIYYGKNALMKIEKEVCNN